MRVLKKAVMGIFDLFLISMVLILLSVLLGMTMGMVPYVVMSGSMEPAIPVGSLCFINENVPYEEIEKGDIIAFELGSHVMVTHRVINVTEEGLETKGDNNDQSDGISTTMINYCGENILHIPVIGYAVAAIQSKRGMILGGTVMVCLFIVYFMFSGDEEDRDEDSSTKKREKGEYKSEKYFISDTKAGDEHMDGFCSYPADPIQFK